MWSARERMSTPESWRTIAPVVWGGLDGTTLWVAKNTKNGRWEIRWVIVVACACVRACVCIEVCMFVCCDACVCVRVTSKLNERFSCPTNNTAHTQQNQPRSPAKSTRQKPRAGFLPPVPCFARHRAAARKLFIRVVYVYSRSK